MYKQNILKKLQPLQKEKQKSSILYQNNMWFEKLNYNGSIVWAFVYLCNVCVCV